MPTRPQSEFRLDPIIREASSAERDGQGYALERYWLRANGEITRNAPFWRSPSDRCFIIVTGTPVEAVCMTFDARLPLAGTSWEVPVSGSLTLSCPQSHVHLLVTRWTSVKRIGNPDRSFADEVIQHLRTEAGSCSEAMLVAASGIARGGTVGSRVAARIQAAWGLIADVNFRMGGADRIVAKDLTVETNVRLVDFETELPVKAVVELSAQPTSLLRALATLGVEHDMRTALAHEIRSFYQDNVRVDDLFELTRRETWKPQLAKRLEQRAFVFGRQARLVQLQEVPPTLPGDAEEVIRLTIPDLVLDGQEKAEINVLSTFRLTNRSMLLRAMAPRPNVAVNTELQQLARAALLRVSATWKSDDLQIAERSRLELDLAAAVRPLGPPYGYELTRCAATTSRDPVPAGLEPALTVTCEVSVGTAEPGVNVQIDAIAELQYRIGETRRTPRGEMRALVEQAIVEEIREHLAIHTPSVVYRGWNAPIANTTSIRDQLNQRIVRRLKQYADDPAAQVTLGRHLEHLQRHDALLHSRIQCEGVRLNPDNVPGEVMVDLNARVVGIPEHAWAEMLALRPSETQWDPISESTIHLPRMMQSAFADVLNNTRNNHVSKRQVIERLGQKIAAAVLEEFKIQIAPEIRLYSPPEVVDFYRRQARKRQDDVLRYFELRDQIANAVFAKRQEKIRLIGEGLATHPELAAVDEALEALQEQERSTVAQTEVLQREFADASQYVSLLTAPPERDTKTSKGPIIDGSVVSDDVGQATPPPVQTDPQ